MSLYHLLNISFFLLAPWKYPAETLGRVLLGSQDVNVNFLPVAKETLSHRGPGSLPHGHRAFSQRSLSVSKSSPLCNQTLRNISASGCSVDRQTPTSGGCIDFQWGGKCLPSELFRAATLAHGQSSAVIVMPVF